MQMKTISIKDSDKLWGIATASPNASNLRTPKKSKFKKGDKVKFVGAENTRRIPKYFSDSDGIPPELIIHGTINLGEEYFETFATVVDSTSSPYVVVRWISDNGTEMQLGFEEHSLELMKKKSQQNKLDLKKLDALIIDEKVKEEIISVLKQHKNKDILFKRWGLGDILEYGFGMTFLFYGPPGTGKTWGATCIAKALGTELMTISPAQIQSSEPGGANRAIEQAFAEAKKSKKVLFIDECDSLITSRYDLGMILASEVNTLLTQIEKFEGVLILATNRIEHMDEALERRISLIAEFPAPKLPQRKDIWNKLLPKKLPLAEDVNKEELAKEELTGGQIKNVVLQAARLALAQEKKEVSKSHFDTALVRIKASKNLMGTASRYHQGPIADVGMGVGKHRGMDKSMVKDFFKTESEKDENVDN